MSILKFIWDLFKNIGRGLIVLLGFIAAPIFCLLFFHFFLETVPDWFLQIIYGSATAIHYRNFADRTGFVDILSILFYLWYLGYSKND